MTRTRQAQSEQRLEFGMEMLVGYVLLVGVVLSLVLVLAALIWRWSLTRNVDFDFQLSGMSFFQLMVNEFRLAIHGAIDPQLLLSLGIVMLMLTPFIRVLVSMLYFMIGLKNWKYSLFTAFVLATLTYSLFLR
jgi:uncharacterized membrane protein